MSNFRSYRGHPPHDPDAPGLRLARHEEAVERTLRDYDPIRAAWDAPTDEPTDEEIDEAAWRAALETTLDERGLAAQGFGDLVELLDAAMARLSVEDALIAAMLRREIAQRVCSLGSRGISGACCLVHGGRIWMAYPADLDLLHTTEAIEAETAEAAEIDRQAARDAE